MWLTVIMKLVEIAEFRCGEGSFILRRQNILS